jgi:hypothetical protein
MGLPPAIGHVPYRLPGQRQGRAGDDRPQVLRDLLAIIAGLPAPEDCG